MDKVGGVLFLLAIGYVPIFIISRVLSAFVGLKAPPTKRAALLVAPAYLTTILLFSLIPLPEDMPKALAILTILLLPAPAALGWFFVYRWQFKKRWVESEVELIEGQSLENDSWQKGLLRLIVAGFVGFLFLAIRDLI